MQSRRTSAILRRENMARAIGLLHVSGSLNRVRLAEQLGVTRSTAKVTAEALAEVGLVVEQVESPGAGRGRPSHALAPAPGGPVVLAVEIAVSHVAVATVGLGTRLLDVAQQDLPPGPEPADVMEIIGTLGRRQLPVSGGPVLGVGVSFYGVVRTSDGYVLHAPSLGWRHLPLAHLVGEALGGELPVSVGNDADLAAMAEARRMGSAEPQDLVYLIAELGLGAGVVSGGALLGGVHGAFGEVGHMVVNPQGRRCACGRIGCWETEVDAAALLRHVGRAAGGDLRGVVADVVAQALAGDARARAGLDAYARWLALGLINVVNIFDPPRIVFGGVLAQVLPAIEADLVQAVSEGGLITRENPPVLSGARLGRTSALIGAADLAMAGLLADPLGWACQSSPVG